MKYRPCFSAFLTISIITSAFALSNSGFESDYVANGSSIFLRPSSWNGPTASIEVVNPYSGAAVQPTEGVNFIRMGSGYNALTQTLATIEAETVYTVYVDVGIEGSFGFAPSDWYRCALIYDGQPGNEFLVDVNHTNFWPNENGWITVELQFSSFDNPELIGEDLQILLTSETACYDNVRFQYSPQWDGVFNGGFDYNSVADGQSTNEFVPSGWANNNIGIELRNPASGESLQASDGDNYLRVINGNVEYYTQGGIHPQTRYEVDLDVAIPGDLSFGWYQARLIYYNGSTWVTKDTVTHITDPIYTQNTWRSIHLEFDAASGDIGHLLRLQLGGEGVAYDNVRITETITRPFPPSTFYISSSEGSDGNSGVSESSPWETFQHINAMRRIPGDRVLLKRGDQWNEELRLSRSGEPGNPIELSAYGTGDKPRIVRSDMVYDLCAVIESPSYWRINNLDCRNAKVGLYLRYNQSRRNNDVIVEDCHFQDMNQIEIWDPAYYNYEIAFNAGIWVGGKLWAINEYQPILENLTVRRCRMHRITHGFGIGWYYPHRYRNRIRNLILEDCWNTGGYGMYLFHINGGHMKRCYFFDGEDGFMPTGTTQTIIQTSQNFQIDSCVFEGTSRQGGTADGTSFDFEGDTYNCEYSNNVSYHTDGQSLLLLNTGGPNKGLLIRDSVFFDTCNDALTWPGHNYEITGGSPSEGTLRNLTFYTDGSLGLFSPTSDFNNFVIDNVNEYPMSLIEGRPWYWHFNTDGDMENWAGANQMTGIHVADGKLKAVSTGADPYIYSPFTWIVGIPNPTWTLSMMADAGSHAQVFFITHNDPLWNEAKSITVPLIADGKYHIYKLDMLSCPEYAGIITQVRVDPTNVSGANVGIDYLKLGAPGTRVKKTSHYPASFSVVRGTYEYVSNDFYGYGDAGILRQKEFCFNICYNPNDYVKANTETWGDYRGATDFVFTGIPTQAETLRVELFGREANSGASLGVSIYMLNTTNGVWDMIESFGSSTVDVTRIAEPAKEDTWKYIDAGGQVTVKAVLTGTSPNTSYHDYVKLTSIERLEIEGDMDLDGDVDMADFSCFTENWGNWLGNWTNGFFDGSDINTDGTVDAADLNKFAKTWQ